MMSQKNRWLDLTVRCLHRGRLHGRLWIEGRSLCETRTNGLTIWQEVLVGGFRHVERVGSLRGVGALRAAGACGASAPSVSGRSDSARLRTSSS